MSIKKNLACGNLSMMKKIHVFDARKCATCCMLRGNIVIIVAII
jgi:hypothetical protein